MARLVLLFIALLFLSSCELLPEPDIDIRIASLEQEIMTLKAENKSLKEQNEFLRQGGLDSMNGVTVLDQGSSNAMQFQETVNTECSEAANKAYFESGNANCRKSGYSEDEIKNGKCKLSQETIKSMEDARSESLMKCTP